MRIEGQESGDLGQTNKNGPNEDKETKIDWTTFKHLEKKKNKNELENVITPLIWHIININLNNHYCHIVGALMGVYIVSGWGYECVSGLITGQL